jgi:hypothetical protein
MTGKLAVAVVLAFVPAFAQSTTIPGWSLAGTNPRAFAIGVDDDAPHGGRIASMRCMQSPCAGFGTLMQTFRADKYVGRRLRLSAWVRAEKAGRADIWMRVDGVDAMLTFDNMDNRLPRGTFGWRRQEIVLDVPDDALTISYGLILGGAGQAWVENFVFEIVDPRVKSTNLMRQATPIRNARTQDQVMRLPADPVNTDFGQRAEK